MSKWNRRGLAMLLLAIYIQQRAIQLGEDSRIGTFYWVVAIALSSYGFLLMLRDDDKEPQP